MPTEQREITAAPEPNMAGRPASDRKWIRHPLTRIAIVALITALAIFRWLPMPWRQPAVGLIAMAWVRIETGGLGAMGLRRPDSIRATLGWALLGTLVVTGLITPVIEPLLDRITGTEADYSGYGALLGNLPAALDLIGRALISAAIGEELVFRGFVLHQISATFGGGRGAQVLSVLAGGAVFGLAHVNQGIVGILLTGITGVLFGAIFFASRRNLWATMLAHAVVDVWGVATLYLGWY